MRYSEKVVELRKAWEKEVENEDRFLDEYMSKIEKVWDTIKVTLRVSYSTLGFKNDFDLFLELESESDTAWEKLGKADPLFYKEWRQTMDSLKGEWAEKRMNNQKNYEGRINQVQSDFKIQELRRRAAKDTRDELKESFD
jgi:hypothetical protein